MSETVVETDFLYLYGVIPTTELEESGIPAVIGIDQKNVFSLIFKELAAIITPVNAQKFSQQHLDLQIKDSEWLKEKAVHHHECIATIHHQFTVLPMTFCTIFQNEKNLKSLLNDQYDMILNKLNFLKGKLEWNIKLYCSMDMAISYVVKHNHAVVELRESLPAMPKGKQFIMKKKLEQLIAAELELEQSRWWKEIEAQLTSIYSDSKLRKNWGKEMTERQDDMIVNCDFLINTADSEQFLNKVQEIEQNFKNFGCTFQVTGPWPPYHFSKIEKEI